MQGATILIPVDGSDAAAAALSAVVPMAKTMGASCVLMAVAEPKLDGRFEHFAASEHASILEAEGSYLEQKAAWLIEQGVPATTHLEASPGVTIAEAITEYAAANDIDWIAMATHGRTGFGRAVFGSVFQAVLKRSPVPILTFPESALTAKQRKTPTATEVA